MKFLNNFFAQEVAVGVLPTLRAGFDRDVKPGDFFDPSRFHEMHGGPVTVKSSDRSNDLQAARELWEKSEELTGITI